MLEWHAPARFIGTSRAALSALCGRDRWVAERTEPGSGGTGFHVGGHVGGAFNDNNSLIGRGGGRLFGGAEVGFDRQFAPGWVLGTEVQFEGLIGNGRGAL